MDECKRGMLEYFWAKSNKPPESSDLPFFRSLRAHIDGGSQHKNIIFQKGILNLITNTYDEKIFVCKP
jgi:hypothetical protein